MEPLSAGAIALLTLLLDKTLDKTIEAGVGEAFEHKDKLLKLLKRKSPETRSAIEKVAEEPELVNQQPEDYGEAILVEKVQEAGEQDAEIRQELEALAEAVKSQPQVAKVIENWKGINIKGGTNTINNPHLTF